jgi:sec-independent protein translocase protein TatA
MLGGHLWELLIILAIVVLIFGVGKFGDVGGALGKSIREFRRESHADENSEDKTSSTSSTT